mgnify:CR=1 FL=1
MSNNIVEELPARKHAPVAAAPSKKGAKKDAKGEKSTPKGGDSDEASAKRIRQAVYDIRYRAKKDKITLQAAFSSYMGNSNLNPAERKIVKERLFGKQAGGVKEQVSLESIDWATDDISKALYKTFVEKKEDNTEIELAYLKQLDESEERKYKVRVTDKNGRAYVRFADRAKITELRQNPNIESVEMTDHGEPYEGERKKGKLTARAKQGKKLDPVGKEDADVDNDGDVDKSDKYLLKRRKAIGKAIRTRAEAYLADGTISTEPKNAQKITGKGVDNYSTGAVTVNPDDGSDQKKKQGVYAHFDLLGKPLSEGQKKLVEMMKKKEEEDEAKLDDMATKDMSKGSCPPDEEKKDKKDTRGMYAKINVIKNKLRSAGQRDPVVMAVMSPTKGQKLNMYGEERTPAKDDPSFSQEYKDNAKKAIEASKKKDKKPYNPYPEAPEGKKQATPTNMAPGKP